MEFSPIKIIKQNIVIIKWVNTVKVLLLYPLFPKTFWSYDRFMEVAGLKALIPPLGIITIASLLPQDWEIRFFLIVMLEWKGRMTGHGAILLSFQR